MSAEKSQGAIVRNLMCKVKVFLRKSDNFSFKK